MRDWNGITGEGSQFNLDVAHLEDVVLSCDLFLWLTKVIIERLRVNGLSEI